MLLKINSSIFTTISPESNFVSLKKIILVMIFCVKRLCQSIKYILRRNIHKRVNLLSFNCGPFMNNYNVL